MSPLILQNLNNKVYTNWSSTRYVHRRPHHRGFRDAVPIYGWKVLQHGVSQLRDGNSGALSVRKGGGNDPQAFQIVPGDESRVRHTTGNNGRSNGGLVFVL